MDELTSAGMTTGMTTTDAGWGGVLRLPELFRPRALAVAAVLCLAALAAPAVADDAPAAPEAPAVKSAAATAAGDAPDAAQPEQATEEQIHAAEMKVRQAEIDLLKARIELLKLKPQTEISRLEEQVQVAETALAALNPSAAEEGFIGKWLLLGPIALDEKVSNHDEDSCKEMLDRQYVPSDAKPKEGEKVSVDGKELAWKAVEAGDYFVDLSKLAEDEGKNPEHAAYLGVAYITCEQEVTDLKLAIGSDDDSVWRLNGKEVTRAYEGRAVDKDQNTAEHLTLKQGVNVLSFTVLNGDGPAAAAARFLDKDGNPVKDLKVSVTPSGE